MQDSVKMLKVLLENDVEFILVGGFAAVIHGVSTVTQDLDLCFHFTAKNVQKLLNALEPLHPVHRVLSRTLPITQNIKELGRFKNLYLKTDIGSLDLLGQVSDVGNYQTLLSHIEVIAMFGLPCKIIDIPSLIKAKKFMGRPKDKQAVVELEAIEKKQGKKK